MCEEGGNCGILDCTNPECIKLQRDLLRERYFTLCDVHASSLSRSLKMGEEHASAEVMKFRNRLVEKLEEMDLKDDLSIILMAFIKEFQ